MLLYFSVRNYKSFYETAELSMVATRERHHSESLACAGRRRIVPATAIYGANAAGKSTLVAALEALRSLVISKAQDDQPLPVVPHLALGYDEPSTLTVEVLAPFDGRDVAFLYEVSADRRRIVSESLWRVRTHDEIQLFERKGQQVTLYDPVAKNEQAQVWAKAIAGEETETLLGRLARAGIPEAKAVRDWFANQLHIIHPTSRYMPMPERVAEDEVFARAMTRGLSAADTGITRVSYSQIDPVALGIPSDQLAWLDDRIEREGRSIVISAPDGEIVVLKREGGRLVAERVMSEHAEQTRSFRLSAAQESQGTRRYMHILPILFRLSETDERAVFVIDELENSLHPHLTRRLIEQFLDDVGPESRRQLIFTTHEVTLMRADLLRRDEMWLAEKRSGESALTRVSDFAGLGARKDADLYGLYMSGRLGGVPTE